MTRRLKEIILFWRICQFDRYRNKWVRNKCRREWGKGFASIYKEVDMVSELIIIPTIGYHRLLIDKLKASLILT